MGIEIKTYSIIYELIDDVKLLLGGMMAPQFREENTGQAEVRDTFPTPRGAGTIAGCVVVDGKLVRGGMVRVIRDGVVIHEGDLTSLRRFKDDVKEVGKGFDCGVVLNGYTDVKVGDVVETFKKIEKKVTL
jgi:translation initiation factor IF-2